MLDLKKLTKQLDETLENETEESSNVWLATDLPSPILVTKKDSKQ